MKYNYSSIGDNVINKLQEACPLNTYRVVSPIELNQIGILPSPLIEKCNSAIIVCSGAATSESVFMVNLNRVDHSAKQVDQMPFGVICSGTKAITSGALMQHGNYLGRTISPPQAFWDQINKSGLNQICPISELPSNSSGNISELNSSQKYALYHLTTELKKHL